MKSTYQVTIMIATTVLLMATLLGCQDEAPPLAGADDQVGDKAQAAKAERIARAFERNARVLTVFDRAGKVTHKIGERAMYRQPVLSPDGTHVAVIKVDLEADSADLWLLDVVTGNSTRVTTSQSLERVQSPVWSPDGSQVAYVALRDSYFGIYRQAADGRGEEELIYQHPGG
ncbi:MAG: hypothetical protein E2O61_03265, partial [Gammaproteobacteria bacterium]